MHGRGQAAMGLDRGKVLKVVPDMAAAECWRAVVLLPIRSRRQEVPGNARHTGTLG